MDMKRWLCIELGYAAIINAIIGICGWMEGLVILTTLKITFPNFFDPLISSESFKDVSTTKAVDVNDTFGMKIRQFCEACSVLLYGQFN